MHVDRRHCRDGNEHAWKIQTYGDGSQHVGCARCMVPLSVREMLDAYVAQYGGSVRP